MTLRLARACTQYFGQAAETQSIRTQQEQHLKELRETFHKFDAQNKGHLSVRELGA